ncbi:GATA transcription factor 8 [Linum perenne]
MVGPTPSSLNFMEELDFFDQIDDLIDFPSDDIDSILPCPDANANPQFFSAADNKTDDDGGCSFLPPSIWAAHPGSDPGFPNQSASDLSAELSVPYEDIVQLEWLSTFVEDSFSGGSLTMNKNECCTLVDKDLSSSSSHGQHFRTSSPVSVLESSSSCSGDQKPEVNNVALGKCGRARSKRPRPATFTPRPPMHHLISPTSSITETPNGGVCLAPKAHSDSENYAESRLLIKIPKHLLSEHKAEPKKKKKKIKVTAPTPPPALAPAHVGLDEENSNLEPEQQQAVIRKCMHCEVTKTPQWRAGPMGPKTLCNACGVRFKSGRLFPEYRPAASPTFVPTLHSNSHKKVVEMRTKVVGDETFGVGIDGGASSMIPDSPELLIPGNNPALEYM